MEVQSAILSSRQMRKNRYEKILLRCEEERFEIDVVIESNVSTLNCLEPVVADEIALLQQSAGSNGGVGGKIFQYYSDQNRLKTIHRPSISCIYGDSGVEIMELLFKNPVIAIPIVLGRLRQKGKEFREAREALNVRWKKLAELSNYYYKSIDQMCLIWRTIDKRATSTKALAGEIKDHDNHNGDESEGAFLQRKEKAKKKHDSFYEVTMGCYKTKRVDLTDSPKPTSSLFTPHISSIHENNSWAQRVDAYRILGFCA